MCVHQNGSKNILLNYSVEIACSRFCLDTIIYIIVLDFHYFYKKRGGRSKRDKNKYIASERINYIPRTRSTMLLLVVHRCAYTIRGVVLEFLKDGHDLHFISF